MGSREDAMNALDQRDWSGAEVEHTPRRVSMVYSTRLPGELAEWLEGEAERRGVNPSQMLRELVAEKKRAAEADDKIVTVRISELHQAIDQLADRAA